MLKSIFVWLDLHPGSYWIIAAAPTLLLVARLIALIGRESRGTEVPPQDAVWRDGVVLLLFLLAWRWPFLLVAHELNPDESQLIAGAMKLTHDPVFWRGVDGGSSGPLNYYFLLPWSWLGAPLDYFTARLTGLLLIWGALLICLRILADAFGRTVAWLGILPAMAFFATVTDPELVHYSTEHLPLLMVAGTFGLLAGRPPSDRIRLWLACLVAGALPWTKLQLAPIAFMLIGWTWWQARREPGATARPRWSRAAEVLVAAALPSVLLAGLIAATGQTDATVRRYFLQNISYVGDSMPFGTAMQALWRSALVDGRFPLFLGTGCAGLAAAAIYFARHRVRPAALLVAGVLVTLAAAAAVVIPRRDFLHYVLLLPVPLTIGLGAAIGGWWQHLASARLRQVLAAVMLAAGLLPLFTRGLQGVPDSYGRFAYDWRHPRSPAAVVLHAMTGRDDTLGIWGWASHLYVESGLPQATRDSCSLWSIKDNARQSYYRAVYLADLRNHRPAVFVDAVGHGAFTFDKRAEQAHETFPELAAYVRQNYTLVVDLQDLRIYARNGLAGLREMSPAILWPWVAQGREPRPPGISPPLNSLDQLQHKLIGHRRVTMLLPPERVEWWLDKDVREVAFEFGYEPVAYEEGRSNGVDFILELVSHGTTRVVYQRFLDPARRPGDRGQQTARVPLPPFPRDTTLVLRTDPGPAGDTAWDWVYLASLQLHHDPQYLPQQFPGFNRVPDKAEGDASNYFDDGPQRVLLLHAPGSLSYALRGSEHRLSFRYGFRPGAYGDGGKTDGAVYRVELQGAGRPARVIFERFLQPARKEEDRGPQLANLTLPPLQPGDVLTLKTDPGPAGNVAWDWTYISSLELQ